MLIATLYKLIIELSDMHIIQYTTSPLSNLKRNHVDEEVSLHFAQTLF